MASIVSNLNRASSVPMFGCTDQVCHIVRKISLSPSAALEYEEGTLAISTNTDSSQQVTLGKHIELPSDWKLLLGDSTPQALWVAAAVSVDGDNVPVVDPVHHVEPLAIQSGDELYKVFRVESSTRCPQASHEARANIDVSATHTCASETGLNHFRLSLMNRIHQWFQYQFRTSRVLDEQLPADEMLHRRNMASAENILGRPYHDVLRLRVRIYTDGCSVRVNVDPTVWIATNINGPYVQANKNQEALYNQALSRVLLLAIQSECEQYPGAKWALNLCDLGGIQ
ncbi:hypothetical protein [Sorangium sp. So ce542]|uniref:hypothetical protein n=1 Tax=Sorangium sp. So ce542 TaxID=3133316 RepID=UPI003F5DB96E